MPLQSQQLNKPLLPASIVGIFLLSLLYWVYLSLTTRMDIVFDSIEYASLGRMIQTHGWIPYFTSGPNREPLYPLLIALAMHVEHLTGFVFTKIMAVVGVLILALTQILLYQLLRLLQVRQGICILILGYFALSPGLNNAAFSLFSEIACLPFVLGTVLISFYAWDNCSKNKMSKALGFSALLGLSLLASTFVKAVFECIVPIYLIIFFVQIFNLKNRLPVHKIILCMVATLTCYYAPITAYKCLNQHYNGNFVITNRASWALYGNTARRMEPLTAKHFWEAVAFVPGEGVCDSIFGAQECDFWSFKKSDEFGYGKLGELNSQHLSNQQINDILIKQSTQKALCHPFQYILLTGLEGFKMFFWESTQIGFVKYPHWLQKIYNIKILNNGLRFLLSLLSLVSVILLWSRLRSPYQSPLNIFLGTLIFLYILFFSFFFILTRYALPIAPLYLITIGLAMEQILPAKK